MATITKNGNPRVSTPTPCHAHRVGSGFLVGETVAAFDALHILAADNLVYKAIANLQAPPPAPTVAGNGAGSAFGAGTYAVQTTYVTAFGETTPSPAVFVTITAAQNLRVSAQGAGALPAGVTGGNIYVNGVKAIATVASAAGSIPQTDVSGSALAVSGGVPFVNTAFLDAKHRVDGYADGAVTFGSLDHAVGIYDYVDMDYGTGLAPKELWLSTSVAGAIDDTEVPGLMPCGKVISATRVRLWASSKRRG